MGRTEFREARAAFDRLARVVRAADFDAALSLLHESEEAIDLIVVAQAYPGQYAADRIDGLRRLAPLARVIGLLGSWCEGEVRSGRPWPRPPSGYTGTNGPFGVNKNWAFSTGDWLPPGVCRRQPARKNGHWLSPRLRFA